MSKWILGLAIAGALFILIFLGIFFTAGADLTDDPLIIQVVFVFSGIAGFVLIVVFACLCVIKATSKRITQS